MTIGRYPGTSLSEARRQVNEYKNEILKGNYPRTRIEQKKREIREMITFDILATRFLASKNKELRVRTFSEYQRIINIELKPVLGKKNIKQIKKSDIASIVDKIAEVRDTPTLANRVLSLLSGMFTYAMERGLIEHHPVIGIKKNKKGENVRERVYNDEEIRSIWEAVDIQIDPVRTCIKFMFATGQRKTETASVRWDQINLDNRTWTIPKEITKNKKDHIVPLSSLAIDLLNEIYPLTGSSEYVFRSTRKDAPLKWLDKAKDRIKTVSGVNDFMYHNIRRTLATKLGSNNVGRTVVGKLLNHKGMAQDNLVTAIYERYDYLDEMRIAVENWGAELMRIVSGNEKEAKITRIGAI